MMQSRRTWMLLGIVQLVAAVTCVAGGVGLLLTDGLGMEVSTIAPRFASFLIPGIILAAAVGGTLGVAGVLTLRASRHAAIWTVLAGVVLSHWIWVEWGIIGFHMLQLPYALLAVGVAGAGWKMRSSGVAAHEA